MVYSALIRGMSLARIGLNRKVLAQLAIQEPYSFRGVVYEARAALDSARTEATSLPPGPE